MRSAQGTMLLAACTFLLAGCSVKEDRDDCPCLLTIDTGQAVEGDMLISLVHESLGVVCQEEVGSGAGTFSTAVPKGTVFVTAFSGNDGWEISDDGLYITLPKGQESGCIYAHSELVDCYDDTAEDIVRMQKQWCTLSIVLDSPGNWDACTFSLEGSWSGFSLENFSAMEGAFSCPMRVSSEGTIQARITRQGDSSLIIRIREEGQADRLRAVGKAIAAAGFDWDSASLDDLTVQLSDCAVEVDLSASDWENGNINENPTI